MRCRCRPRHRRRPPLLLPPAADVLYDVEEEEELFWRPAGASWEPPADEAGQGEEGEEGRVVYSLQEIDEAIKQREQ